MKATEPCGQHTVWDLRCRTCRRLAGLEERYERACIERDQAREDARRRGQERDAARAALAAAPELLAVLGDILNCAALGAVPKHVWDRALAVHAKAEGRTP
ncbi:MAG: hypothetical protein JXA90_09060 [Planctomycetes bacterium]|nr:hypothetical protein [Planctomycetota bacterium]